jgi:hypothetical protein
VEGKSFGMEVGDLGREGRWSQKAADNLSSYALVSSIVLGLWNHIMPHDHQHVCICGQFGFAPSHQCDSHEATSLLELPADATHTCAPAQESRGLQEENGRRTSFINTL